MADTTRTELRDIGILRRMRDVIRSLLAGMTLFLLSVSVIVLQNRHELVSLMLDRRLAFSELLPVLAFFFSCVHLWYYTCKASKFRRRRLQLWIGNVRAVVLSGSVLLIIDYL